jgi:5,10-methylenetetrahydromethanopterin reductase
MRIGVMLSMPGTRNTINGLIESAQRAETAGFDSAWLPNVFDFDAIGALTLAGHETERITLGTAIVPSYPRHPTAMAQQALTAQAAARGRFVLGIGLSHRVVIEDMLGLDYSKPIPHMRDYLTILGGLLAGERVVYQGEQYKVAAQLAVPEATRPPVLVAALGPAMLKLTGRLADGTITWMGGVNYLRDVAVPAITAAAQQAGKPRPRVTAMVPLCLTTDQAAARETANKNLAMYGTLPSYRATLDRGGAAGPGDVAVAGTDEEIGTQIRAYADAGVTDLVAAIYDAPGASVQGAYELLAALAKEGSPAVGA